MNERDNRKIDIHDRIYRWVIKGLKFLDKVPRNIKTIPIISQLSRSITSVGANDKEANSAQTVNDFCHKYSIVKKEADESVYWIRILSELFASLAQEAQTLSAEGEEIINIVATIIRNSRKTSIERKLNRQYEKKQTDKPINK